MTLEAAERRPWKGSVALAPSGETGAGAFVQPGASVLSGVHAGVSRLPPTYGVGETLGTCSIWIRFAQV